MFFVPSKHFLLLFKSRFFCSVKTVRLRLKTNFFFKILNNLTIDFLKIQKLRESWGGGGGGEFLLPLLRNDVCGT